MPDSIVINIMEYAAEREVKGILDDIKLKGILSSYNYINNYVNYNLSYNKYTSIHDLRKYKKEVDNYLGKYNARQAIKCLYKCNCCVIHNYDKPKNIGDISWLDKTLPLEKTRAYKNQCTCSCRHVSREIFRLYHNNKQPVSWTNMINSYYNVNH